MTSSAHEIPDCAGCLHYYITHDASFPYGCRALDFKSRRKPHLDVLDASGKPCMAYEPRPEKIHRRKIPGGASQ